MNRPPDVIIEGRRFKAHVPGECEAYGCVAVPDPGGSFCRTHWLMLPPVFRRDIVEATNAFKLAPDKERDRFRQAWLDAVIWINENTLDK